MSEITNLKQILEQNRVKNGIYNFLCMKGGSDFPFGRFFIPEENKWITLKLSASALKTINKKGISEVLKKARKQGLIK